MLKGVRAKPLNVFVWLCLIVVALFTSFSPQVQAAENGNIGGHPAYPQPGNPRSNSIFIHTINPGQSEADGVQVVNYTNQTKTLQIYATDSIVSSGGAFGCAQQVEEKENVGGWIKLKVGEVTLKPNTEQLIPFSINVPQLAEVGESDGCIVIQEKNGPTQNLKQSGGGSVSISFRTAIRVAVLVPGEIKKSLAIVDYTITHSSTNDYILQPKVKNTGNVSIDTDLQTITSNMFGLQKNIYKQQFPILRGATSEWNIEYKRPFWGGIINSKFVISYDTNTANTIGDQSNKITTSLVSKKIRFISWPTPMALTIYVLALCAALGLLWSVKRKQKRRRHGARSWIEYRVGGQDDINSIARRYGVSWKTLAKTNKLKAPYTLRAGDKIKVPPPKKGK
jgi:hypothetical protein